MASASSGRQSGLDLLAEFGLLMIAGRRGALNAEKSAGKRQKTVQELKALAEFDRITEAASALMDAGEMDIYSTVREELQRAADAFKDDDDMFADAEKDVAKVCFAGPVGDIHSPALVGTVRLSSASHYLQKQAMSLTEDSLSRVSCHYK